jgi:hypothetical protein
MKFQNPHNLELNYFPPFVVLSNLEYLLIYLLNSSTGHLTADQLTQLHKNLSQPHKNPIHLMKSTCICEVSIYMLIDYLTKYTDELLIYKDGEDNAVVIMGVRTTQ